MMMMIIITIIIIIIIIIIDFVIKLNARRSQRFDLSEFIFKCE